MLDIAWKIAMNSVTRKIEFNVVETDDFLAKANRAFSDIDREDWWPEAESIFLIKPSIGYKSLAEEASAKVLNKKMEVDYLTVYLGGDT